MNNLLISDLVIKFLNTNDELYIKELKRRFDFCGFKHDEYINFILFEEKIKNKHKNNIDQKILDNCFVIGNESSEKIFHNIEDYIYNPSDIKETTLYTSQLISIIDEAIVLTYSSKINKYKSEKKIKLLAKEKTENWIYYEFLNRMEYICRCANKIDNNNLTSLFENEIGKLYDNEMQICILTRWDKKTVAAKDFEPYGTNYND